MNTSASASQPNDEPEANEPHTEAEAPVILTPEALEEAAKAFVLDDTAALKTEVAELKDQLLRAVAETENVRKRGQRDAEETSKYAVTAFARDMVSVSENLARALESVPEAALEGNDLLRNLRDGVDMTMRELLGAFEKHNIHRIHPLGEKFDHNFHQAIVQIEESGAEPGTVVQVLQAGYTIHDRLLRPALVGVAKLPAAPKLDTEA